MRHRKSGRKFSRTASHRKAMFRNMVMSLFEHGRITTTDERAKELRRVADRLVTIGKKNTLHARRLAARQIHNRAILCKLFDEIAPGYAERNGGYTRIVKMGNRTGDNAMVSLIELMPFGPPQPKRGRRPVAPAPEVLKPTAAIPETKERFDEPEDDVEVEAEAIEVDADADADADVAEATDVSEDTTEDQDQAPQS